VITDAAGELLATLNATGDPPSLLRGLEQAARREVIRLVMAHARARRDAIGFPKWLAEQLRRRGRLASLVRHLEDRSAMGRTEASILLHRVREIVRGRQHGGPVDAVRAAPPVAPPPPLPSARIPLAGRRAQASGDHRDHGLSDKPGQARRGRSAAG